ncbi:MAG: sugar transferase [Aureliella sp.]
MLSWLSALTGRPWTRNTQWTPLLESQREFQRTLAKERARVDRHGGRFGVIVLKLESTSPLRRQAVAIARLLHRRLRDTDEKGHIGMGRIGVLLPCTGAADTCQVMEDLLDLAAEQKLLLDGQAFSYPDDEDPGTCFSDIDVSLPHTLEQHDGVAGQAGVSRVTGAARSPARSVAHPNARPLSAQLMVAPYPTWKRTLDIVGAVIGLIVFAPVLAVAILLIKLTSRGPVFFKQLRTGYLGKTFTIYKLRSMVVDAEAMRHTLTAANERDGPAFKMARDPRVTKLGRVLRATGLDELPQFFNVLRGDMSLVGPRPLPVFEAQECSAWQRQRHNVKPGLTCYWQLIKSRQVSFDTWMRLDMHYARQPSLRRDLRLIAKTFSAVVAGRVGH